MTVSNNLLTIAGAIAAIVLFLFVAVGPPAADFRALLHLVLEFVVAVQWPLTVVFVVFILRKPLAVLAQRGAGQMQTGAPPASPSAQQEAENVSAEP